MPVVPSPEELLNDLDVLDPRVTCVSSPEELLNDLDDLDPRVTCVPSRCSSVER